MYKLSFIVAIIHVTLSLGLVDMALVVDLDTPVCRIWAEIEINSHGVAVVEWGT